MATETALVYCENQFGRADGKTATGLVRHSDIYTIVGVIDSSLAGRDAGEVLGGKPNRIPIFADLNHALRELPKTPDWYIYGKAPLEARISPAERLLILEAMEAGMGIVNGLHQFFTDDAEFVQAAAKNGVRIKDVRKPPHLRDLHVFSGQIAEVNVPVIAMLGTDCACGKMTTAMELNAALNDAGISCVLVATGQTGMMQGAKYGATIDALPSQFVIGEIENAVISAFENEHPDIILIEGQSAVSHPAFMSSIGILKGSMPAGVILQHPPARRFRCDFPDLPMPSVESEIALIEALASTRVVAITLSHEGMTTAEVLQTIAKYEIDFGVPTTDVLTQGCDKLVRALVQRFPQIIRRARRERPTYTFPTVRNLLGKAHV